MKIKLLIAFVFLSLIAKSQIPNYSTVSGGYNYTDRLRVGGSLKAPAGTTAAKSTGSTGEAGYLFIDSTGGNKGLFYSRDGVFIRVYDTTMSFSSSLNPLGQYKLSFSGRNDTKGLTPGLYILMDSSATNVTVRNDTATMFPQIRSTIGTTALTATQLAYGSVGNTITSSSFFTVNPTAHVLTVDSAITVNKGLITFFATASGTTRIFTTAGGGIVFGPDAALLASHDVTSTDFIAIGSQALYRQNAGSRSNIAIGKVTFSNLTTGGSDVGVGADIQTTTGSYITAVGHEIAQNGTANTGTTAIGYRVLNALIDGINNTGGGKQSMESMIDGGYNTTWGIFTLGQAQHGSNNLALGRGAGWDVTGTVNNRFFINGSEAYTNHMFVGDFASTAHKVGINYPSSATLTFTLDVGGTQRIASTLTTPAYARQTDTTGYDVDVIDRSTGLHKKLYAGLVGGSSGLTVGTTTIASGTTTRILYDNAGVLGEYTLTGTGTVVAMQTAPTFVTSITDPLVIGGTAVSSTLTLKSTSGVGSSDAILFTVGNNGATEAARVNTSGEVLVGSATDKGTGKLQVTGSTQIFTDGAGTGTRWYYTDGSQFTGEIYRDNSTGGLTMSGAIAKLTLINAGTGIDMYASAGAHVTIRPQGGGFLGVGATVTPTQMLSVNGQVRIHAISNVGTADSSLFIEDGILKAGAATLPLSSIVAATTTNTINNGASQQEWQWNTLAGTYGLRLTSTSTAAAAGSQILFSVELSGANATGNEVTVAAQAYNTHTGTGTNFGFVSTASGNVTNIGANISANGGTNNYAIIVPSGQGSVGIGTSTPSALLHIIKTTEQLRVGYDASNYYKVTVGSTGGVTYDATGSGSSFTFNDPVILGSTGRLKNYTVATLPAGTQGDVAFVTDALAPSFLATIVGGGVVVAPVFYNGSNWVSF